MDAIDAVNKYVDAYNNNAPNIGATSGPAIDSLNRTADLVSGSLSAPLSPELTTALNGWVDAARGACGGRFGERVDGRLQRGDRAVERLQDGCIESLRCGILSNLRARSRLFGRGMRL